MKNICKRSKNGYNLFILYNQQVGDNIESQNEERAATRKEESINVMQPRLNTGISTAAAMQDDSPLKPKQLGANETQKDLLLNLNSPATADDSTNEVESTIDTGEQEVLITNKQDTLAELNVLKVQLVV